MPASPKIPRAIWMKAAAWFARINADDRSIKDEHALQDWLMRDSRHRTAFAAVIRTCNLAAAAEAIGLPDTPLRT